LSNGATSVHCTRLIPATAFTELSQTARPFWSAIEIFASPADFT
jgi:hypothetical protein